MSRDCKHVGLVAIGKDEGERLMACLRSVPHGIPIVYVDSGSKDGSVQFARSVGAQVVELDDRLPFTAARARNEGFAELINLQPDLDFVQFIDGDCELENGWFPIGLDFLCEQPRYAVVCGRRRERFPDISFYNRMCDEEWETPTGDAEACGGDALYRVSAFVNSNGFDPAIIAGEEPELCLRLRQFGWMIHRLDVPMTIHDANMTRAYQWWMRSVRCGFGYAQVWWKTRSGTGPSIYGRQVASALFWSIGVIGLTVALASLLTPWALFIAPGIWAVQSTRLGFRCGWRTGLHLLVGKFAEALGALRFARSALRGRKHGAIFYK